MANIDDKLDKLLEDVAVIKVKVEQHSDELDDLKIRLVPVFYNFTGAQWALKVAGGLIGLIVCVTGILALLR